MNDFKLNTKQKINSGFKTPDHYFDEFSEKLLQKLPENESKVIPLFAQRKTWFYVAAAILILALSIPIVNQYNTQKTEIDATTLENYLAINSGITEVDLIDLLQEKDIEQIKINHQIDDKTVEDILITNTNIEEYLID